MSIAQKACCKQNALSYLTCTVDMDLIWKVDNVWGLFRIGALLALLWADLLRLRPDQVHSQCENCFEVLQLLISRNELFEDADIVIIHVLIQDFVIVLDERGQNIDSERMARMLAEVRRFISSSKKSSQGPIFKEVVGTQSPLYDFYWRLHAVFLIDLSNNSCRQGRQDKLALPSVLEVGFHIQYAM